MNLILTEICNRACPYCFAQRNAKAGAGAGPAASPQMSMDGLQKCINFAIAGGLTEIKFLGGEPTLHPRFMDFIRIVRGRGLTLRIFSNGLWPDAVQQQIADYLKATGDGGLWFIFNINEPSRQAPTESQRQARSLQIAGPRGRCGFNIYHEDFDLRFLGPLIRRYNLQCAIRIGMASPIVGVTNAFMDFESLRRAGGRLADQARDLQQQDVLLSFDCGVPLCMFTEAQLGAISLCTSPDDGILSSCRPPIDVGPDLTVWPCFPLRGLMDAKLTDYANRNDLMSDFATRIIPLQRLGMREECLTCRLLKRRQCCGGCVAHTVRNLTDQRA